MAERDYVVPSAKHEARLYAGTAVIAADAAQGEMVAYKSFATGKEYTLSRFTGRYVAILIGQADLSTYTTPRVLDAVDRLDRIYAHLTEITGIEPRGDGLLPIAFVELPTNTYGIGFLGAKGVELRSGGLSATQDLVESTPIIHELAHNFDHFSDAILYGNDPAHTWVNFLITFVQHYDREGFYLQSAETLLRSEAGVLLRYYLSVPGFSWETCIRDNACGLNGRMGEITLAGLMEKVAEIHGPDTIKHGLRFLSEALVTRDISPFALTDLERNDLLIESLSRGAGRDLSCFFDDLRWPVSTALRTTLAAELGGNTSCLDADADGATGYQGDCADGNPLVGPGASETQNAIDDDCSGAVDDLAIVETVDFPNGQGQLVGSFPFQVRGSIPTFEDVDNLRFNMPSAGSIQVEFDTDASFKFNGYAYLIHTNGTTATAYLNRPVTIAVPAGQVSLSIWTVNGATTGAYRLSVRFAPEPFPFSSATPPAMTGPPGILVLAGPPLPTTERARRAVDPRVRFWVEGIGWVGDVPIVGGAALLPWVLPPAVDLSNRAYRVQFLDGAIPITPASAARKLADRATPTKVSLPDARISMDRTTGFVGDGTRNNTGAGQLVRSRTGIGDAAPFFLKVKNVEDAVGPFTVKGTQGSGEFVVRYFDKRGVNITQQVLAGTYSTASLPQGGEALIRAKVSVKATAAAGAKQKLKIVFQSTLDPSQRDAVRVIVTAK